MYANTEKQINIPLQNLEFIHDIMIREENNYLFLN
jgi:hypothetical protein